MAFALGVALAAAGCGGGGNDEKVPSPAPPDGLAAEIVAGPSVLLGWNDNADNETGYLVERSADGGASFQQVGPELAPNSHEKLDATAVAGTSYLYRVAALGVGGTARSGPTPMPFTVAAAPSAVVAVATSSTSIGVSWTNNAADALAFDVYRSGDDVTFSHVANVTWTPGDPAVTVYDDGGRAASTTYYYRVTATNLIGEGAQSASGSATTDPAPLVPPDAAPTGFAAGTPTSTTVPLTWACAATNETGFKIWRATTSTFPGGAATYLAAADATSYTATGLSSATTWYFWIAATNAQGDNPVTPSTWVSATTLVSPPAAPSGFSATAVGTKLGYTGIRFAWTDNSGNETGFPLQVMAYSATFGCAYKGSWTTFATAAVNATSLIWDFPGSPPAPGTRSCFRVGAANAGGTSYTGALPFTMP